MAFLHCSQRESQLFFTATPTTEIYPGGNEHPSWLVARVVDDITGTPIANADVFLVREADTPVAGQFWYTRKVKSDANGWMRAPIGDIKDKWHMQVLRHPQYGGAARAGSGDTTWRARRPRRGSAAARSRAPPWLARGCDVSLGRLERCCVTDGICKCSKSVPRALGAVTGVAKGCTDRLRRR